MSGGATAQPLFVHRLGEEREPDVFWLPARNENINVALKAKCWPETYLSVSYSNECHIWIAYIYWKYCIVKAFKTGLKPV